MTTSLIIRGISCFALLAWLAMASLGAEPAAKAELPELVPGDAYGFSLVGQTTEEASQAIAVKQTAEWVVFGNLLSEGRGDVCNEYYAFACDVINELKVFGPRIDPRKVPYVGKWLTKRTEPSFQKAYCWVPRANLEMLDLVGVADDSIYNAVFQGDSPELEEISIPPDDSRRALFVIDRTAKQIHGDTVTFASGHVTVTSGGLTTKLPIADVRCIYHCVPFDFENFKKELEQQPLP